MTTYVALLRGVNVGGNGKLSMGELRAELTSAGLTDVRTYINSGNVIFDSTLPADKLTPLIQRTIKSQAGLDIDVVVFTAAEWHEVIKQAPSWWGQADEWRHNVLVAIPPIKPQAVLDAMAARKPEIERVLIGHGVNVVYQSYLFAKFGQTSSSRLMSSPAYKQLTIRNYNTAHKLDELLSD